MKKRTVGIAILAGLAISANALIIDYQMGDPAGTLTSGLVNSGTDSGDIAGDVQGAATTGTGSLRYTGLTANSTKKHALDVTYSSGSFQLTYRVAAWDYTANTDSDGISFALWDSVSSLGLKAMIDYNVAGTRVRVTGTNGKQVILNQSSGTDLIIRTIANLDANTFSADYNLGGAGWIAIATDEVLGISSIDEFRLIADGTPSWGAGASVDVDYATMEAVPEPSTTGLMGAAALAIFLARNKRKTRAEKIIQGFERDSEY